jgi:hypothetical protein
VVNVEGAALVTASTSSPSFVFSYYAQSTQTALASLEAPPIFKPLRVFELHLQEEYGGFRRDQMQRIQDF